MQKFEDKATHEIGDSLTERVIYLSTLSQKPQAQHFVPPTLMCLYYEAPLPTSRIRGEAQFILAPVPVVSPIAYRSTDYTSGDPLAFTAPGMATDGTLTDGK